MVTYRSVKVLYATVSRASILAGELTKMVGSENSHSGGLSVVVKSNYEDKTSEESEETKDRLAAVTEKKNVAIFLFIHRNIVDQ